LERGLYTIALAEEPNVLTLTPSMEEAVGGKAL
jgi:hypothetical protein